MTHSTLALFSFLGYESNATMIFCHAPHSLNFSLLVELQHATLPSHGDKIVNLFDFWYFMVNHQIS